MECGGEVLYRACARGAVWNLNTWLEWCLRGCGCKVGECMVGVRGDVKVGGCAWMWVNLHVDVGLNGYGCDVNKVDYKIRF